MASSSHALIIPSEVSCTLDATLKLQRDRSPWQSLKSDFLEVCSLIAFSETQSDVIDGFQAVVMHHLEVFNNLLMVCSPSNLSVLFHTESLTGFPFQSY